MTEDKNYHKYERQRYEMDSFKRGFYIPSFFRLGINTYKNLEDLHALDSENFSIFFHEYIHFLQDITTTFGVVNTNIIVDKMKYFNTDIRIKGIKEFKVPYQINSNPEVNLNSEIQKIYLGDKTIEPNDIACLDVQECDSHIFLPSPYNKYLNYVKLSYKDINGNTKEMNFGGYHIMESMAHIGQNFIHETLHNKLPYHAAQMVAKKVYEAIGENDLYIFSLCDACLLTYQPGVSFLRVLKFMKDENFIPTNEFDVFDFVLKKIKLEGIPLLSQFSWASGFATLQLGGYFTTPLFDNEKKWIHTLLTNAHKLRASDPHFLIKLVNCIRSSKDMLMEVISKIGTPLMLNAENRPFFIPPRQSVSLDLKPERFSAIFEIFRLFEFGNTKCDLNDYCIVKDPDIVNETCDVPWSRCHDKDLCPYAAQWKTWGLSEFSPATA